MPPAAAAQDAHREVAQAILDLGVIDFAIIVGHLGLHTAERLSGGTPVPRRPGTRARTPSPDAWTEDRYALVSDLDAGQAGPVAALLKPGDMVLLKGSRRMRLERIVEAMRERCEQNVPAKAGSH